MKRKSVHGRAGQREKDFLAEAEDYSRVERIVNGYFQQFEPDEKLSSEK